MPAVGARTLW